MPHFGPESSECRVYTRRAGVLSAIGHDLEIAVDRYEITVETAPLRVHARFDARSLHVVGAVHGSTVLAGQLSDGDRAQIDRQIADEILQAARHPYVEFTSTAVEPDPGGFLVRGRLRLHGAERPIAFQARRTAERSDVAPPGSADALPPVEADVVLHQPDFGIKPYRAFGGALRLHPDVRVRIRLLELGV